MGYVVCCWLAGVMITAQQTDSLPPAFLYNKPGENAIQTTYLQMHSYLQRLPGEGQGAMEGNSLEND